MRRRLALAWSFCRKAVRIAPGSFGAIVLNTAMLLVLLQLGWLWWLPLIMLVAGIAFSAFTWGALVALIGLQKQTERQLAAVRAEQSQKGVWSMDATMTIILMDQVAHMDRKN